MGEQVPTNTMLPNELIVPSQLTQEHLVAMQGLAATPVPVHQVEE